MHTVHNKWRKPKAKYVSKKKEAQLKNMRNKLKNKQTASSESTSGAQREAAAALQSNTHEVTDLTDSDEFLFVHSSFFVDLFRGITCSVCSSKTVSAKATERNGLCVKVVIYCKNCDSVLGDSYTSPRAPSQTRRKGSFIVNSLIVESTNSIGVGNAALEKFCSNSKIRPMSSRTFRNHLDIIAKEQKVIEEKVLADACTAVRKAHVERDPSLSDKKVIDIACSYDGTWHRRGHNSLYGVGIVIDILTGLVVDYEILSKYCHLCTTTAAALDEESPEFNIWHEGHVNSSECSINFSGSSGSMEVRAAEIMWQRSITKNSLRYTTILSDGDARTWTRLNEIAPYGSSCSIIKEECINHVHKRMGKGLRDLAQKERLGGKSDGSLTVAKISLLTKYYRRAIVNNLESVEKMQQAIEATLLHCSSTDQKPNHRLCPSGSDSWCFFQRAKALKQKPASHKSMNVKLNNNVVEKIKPLYDRLSDQELLERCSRGATQNVNEGLHAQIWRRCPKEIFVSKKRISSAVIQAVMEKNFGILKAEELKATLRKEKLSGISEETYQRMDTRRTKRKADQAVYRHSKRARKCAENRNKQSKSKDYGSGEH